MSMRFTAAINKPGFNPLGTQTSVSTYTYLLYRWGNNSGGQLGLGDTTNRSSPNQVGSINTWATGKQGNNYSLAIKTDGTLWAVGACPQGQTGLNTSTYYSSPKQVGALTNWLNATFSPNGYGYHVLVIKSTGNLWSWGANNNGQLGLGNITAYSSPKQVGSLTNWLSITAGGYQSLPLARFGEAHAGGV